MTAVYEIRLEPAGNTWLATAPAFAEVITFGLTPDEAIHQASRAIERAIAGRLANGEAIPLPMQTPPAAGPSRFATHFQAAPDDRGKAHQGSAASRRGTRRPTRRPAACKSYFSARLHIGQVPRAG